MTKKEQLMRDIAQTIMEVESVTPETTLDPWDSMAWVVAQVAIDDAYGMLVEPAKLRDCVTVADVLRLAGEPV